MIQGFFDFVQRNSCPFVIIILIYDRLRFAASFSIIKPSSVPPRYNFIDSGSENCFINQHRFYQSRCFYRTSSMLQPYALASSGDLFDGDLQQYGKKLSEVIIESPSMNSRKITANIIINCPMQTVWSILTDYNRLATHVPNLVQSYLVPAPNNGLRLFQEGAQRIIGFDFRASLLMDMTEEQEDDNRALRQRQLSFKLVESQMFSAFDGSWTIRYHSRSREFNTVLKKYVYVYKTKLTYTVSVKPKGPVPVMALEWRIKEDVPVNLLAVKLAAEKLPSPNEVLGDEEVGGPLKEKRIQRSNWGADETLGSYIPKPTARFDGGGGGGSSLSRKNIPSALITTPFLYVSVLQDLINEGRMLWASLS